MIIILVAAVLLNSMAVCSTDKSPCGLVLKLFPRSDSDADSLNLKVFRQLKGDSPEVSRPPLFPVAWYFLYPSECLVQMTHTIAA